jgi:[ribosomal protein S5]-alanine N-acetyltransferase
MMRSSFSFGPFPTLRTKRLVLRELTAFDADSLLRFLDDIEIQRYHVEPIRDIHDVHTFIAEMRADYIERKQIVWAITGHDPYITIALANLHTIDHRLRTAAAGCDLARACRGEGIEREAVAAVIRFGIIQMRLLRIEDPTVAD